jgi:hypothetical protein
MVCLHFSVHISCAVEYIVYMYLSVLHFSRSAVTAKVNYLSRPSGKIIILVHIVFVMAFQRIVT